MNVIERVRGRGRPSLAPAPARVVLDHEEVVVRRGERSGADVIVAIHSTALGPALGGVRMWAYGAGLDALGDALRLSAGMTYKAAAAGLDLGGGKGVIRAPAGNGALEPDVREAMLFDFADLVESLEGRYITAEDVGTATEDMTAIHTITSHVTGLPPEDGGSGDPSPFTAMGVEAAIRACVAYRRGGPELDGLRIVVVGLGHVGSRLAARLAACGAKLTVADADPAKRQVAERLGARWVEPAEAMRARCDVLAPCALGGVIDESSIDSLGAGIVCGAANNQLTHEGLAERLAERGVIYAPDFIANAGGLVNVYRELHGLDEDWAREHAAGIEDTMARILAIAEDRGIVPLTAAYELARERLEHAVTH
jgi:leucine dehydrogenase